MEARLLENLSNKLGDLEGKLEAYRQDLLNDFHQFYDSQLRDTDPAVVCNIQRSIEPSLSSEFPGLRPYLRQRPADSVPPVGPKTATTFQTLAAPTNSGSPDAPGSARDRDHELEGVFTPSYLPLLACSQQSPPPGASTPAHADDAAPRDSQPPPPPAGPEAGLSPSHSPKAFKMEEKTDSGAPSARSLPPLQTSGDGEAGDRASDDSNLSEASDKGDSKGIRSALRRSSSISTKTPQSPRRVRFEFKGAEVLPTSSPQPDDHMIPRPISPVPDTEQVTADSILGEDAEDSPPPRKVSSSDALRALSRAPLEEDGTVWTVVNAQSDDGSASASAQSSDTEDGSKTKQTAHNPPVAPTTKASGSPGANATQVHQEPDTTDDIGSDDDALAISKNTKPHAGTSPKGKMKQPASIESARQPDPEGDDMFHFEDDNAQPGPQPGRQPVSERREEEVEEDQDVNISDADDAGLDKSASAISSSLTISRPEPKAEKTQPTSPLASKFQIGSVGSYKGRSLIMPIVKNPELHAQAASQGDFDSFVGGVDGRSGIDESDLSSYRASIAPGGFVGTPRSFTERLLMEDMEAERAKNTQAR